MAETNEGIPGKYLDKRTLGRRLERGQVEEKAFEKYMKSLPDVTEKGQGVETPMIDHDLDDMPIAGGSEAPASEG